MTTFLPLAACDMEGEYSSASDEETPVREGTSVPERRRHACLAEIVAVLRAYHQKGMDGKRLQQHHCGGCP